MKDYKKSTTFENEVTEVGAFNYEIGFHDCKEKVKEHFLELDLHKVVADGEEVIGEGDEEGEIQEEAVEEIQAKEVALLITISKIPPKLVHAEEVAPLAFKSYVLPIGKPSIPEESC